MSVLTEMYDLLELKPKWDPEDLLFREKEALSGLRMALAQAANKADQLYQASAGSQRSARKRLASTLQKLKTQVKAMKLSGSERAPHLRLVAWRA